jgi:oligopeptide/dipeptide ABC transporter ATP-binding protein
MIMAASPLLIVRGLTVAFPTPGGRLFANRTVSLAVAPGETLGIVGESGSGKSVLLRAIMGLVASPPAQIGADEISFDGRDLMAMPPRQMRALRGQHISMIFQNPMSSLNPVRPIGEQVFEGLRIHQRISRAAAREAAIDALRRVGIPSAEIRVDDYPHQWSGGMAQRAVIAMAMIGGPKLLLADEPTTALDVTIQDQILALLVELQRETGTAIILVSHDMSVISETCDQVMVMYAGSAVESGSTSAIFGAPAHPYTAGLLGSIPRADRARGRLIPIPGQPPDLFDLPPGCPFAPRCPVASAECSARPIVEREVAEGHMTACHFPERVASIDRKAVS